MFCRCRYSAHASCSIILWTGQDTHRTLRHIRKIFCLQSAFFKRWEGLESERVSNQGASGCEAILPFSQPSCSCCVFHVISALLAHWFCDTDTASPPQLQAILLLSVSSKSCSYITTSGQHRRTVHHLLPPNFLPFPDSIFCRVKFH